MSQTIDKLLQECVVVLIHPTGKLSRTACLVLMYSDYESLTFDIVQQDEDDYYNIMHDNSVIGGIKQDEDGRIHGKINLSDVSNYGTCIITQLVHNRSTMLLQPVKPKAKYDPHRTNFIKKEEFNNEDS